MTPAGGLGPWLTCHPQQTGLFAEAIADMPAWTPDGQAVLFSQFAVVPPDEVGTHLWLVRPGDPVEATTQAPPRTRLTQDLTDALRATVAPDGVTVAFESTFQTTPTGAFLLFTIDRRGALPVPGAQATCLTCEKALGFLEATQPAWSPGLP